MKKIASILIFCAASTLIASCNKDESSNVNSNDQIFVKKASTNNFIEVTLGQIAADSATDPSVKQFGAQMVSDHTAMQQQLQSIASALGIDATATLDAEHILLRDSLLSLKGRTFDSIYIHSQVREHETAIDFFKQQSAHGLQKEVKQYMYQTLADITLHLQAAKTISTNY